MKGSSGESSGGKDGGIGHRGSTLALSGSQRAGTARGRAARERVLVSAEVVRPTDERGEGLTLREYLALRERNPDTAARSFLCVATRQARIAAKGMHLGADAAEDLAMECCVAAEADHGRALQRCDADVSLGAWVRGVVGNFARVEVRRQAGARRAAEGRSLPYDQAAGRARLRDVRQGRFDDFSSAAHGALTPLQREALAIHVSGVSYAMVGRRLGVGTPAARDRVERAWKALERAAGEGARGLPTAAPLPTNALFLTARAQKAYELRLAGKSVTDVARELRCSRAAAHSLLQRLRSSFRRANGSHESESKPPVPPPPLSN